MQETHKVYELGFHLVPTLSDDALSTDWAAIKALVEAQGGTFISEQFPQPFTLAYELSKTEKGVKRTFDRSFFGWVKFELDASKADELHTQIESRSDVLRFVIVKTVKENTLHGDPEKKERDAKKAEEEKSQENVEAKVEELATS